MRGVTILGATGSVGASTLAVLAQHAERFRPVALTAHRNGQSLAALVAGLRPELAVLVEGPLPEPLPGPTRWVGGRAGLIEAATHPAADIVVNALVGAAGLEPTLAALRAGKRVALANKESLVCGGPLVLEAARTGGGELIPVDSEHSAVLQCLPGGSTDAVRRLLLTASGGPFRTLDAGELAGVGPDAALRHPTWSMGAKITIDSATLANKALEVIEAHFLFGVPYDRIEVVVHPQSIIHSMVEMVDGSVLAQMGFPTMELPLLYALTHPRRLPYETRRFDPVAAGTLTFEAVDAARFPTFALGVGAGHAGGTAPAVFNAANEVAVSSFLEGRSPFGAIAGAVEETLSRLAPEPIDDLEAVLRADARARETARRYLTRPRPC
jgi:1-deoxy-D-xylulose-5-phosphate reductoisomerase